ncbi:hypothetical protein AB0F71_02500 [Kitasatospora sp. NPDC028055]|uniref:hypothetical protein n=1 Tax=Kitasatospora sp. NPDC028055 TaxID=3155653 RepID=UPI0033E107A8
MATMEIGQGTMLTAPHCVPKLPSWHECSRLHQHIYEVTAAAMYPQSQTTWTDEQAAEAARFRQQVTQLWVVGDGDSGPAGREWAVGAACPGTELPQAVSVETSDLARRVHQFLSADLPSAVPLKVTVSCLSRGYAVDVTGCAGSDLHESVHRLTGSGSVPRL